MINTKDVDDKMELHCMNYSIEYWLMKKAGQNNPFVLF